MALVYVRKSSYNFIIFENVVSPIRSILLCVLIVASTHGRKHRSDQHVSIFFKQVLNFEFIASILYIA